MVARERKAVRDAGAVVLRLLSTVEAPSLLGPWPT
jgi:hypothetical protein